MPPRPKPKRNRAKHFFREWREQKYPRQADAEEALGWSQSKVSRLEKGETPYDQDDIEHAAEIFGCSPADLISGPPGHNNQSPESRLRSALLSFGVDKDELTQVVDIISTFVHAERPEESPSPEHSQLANHHRATAPSE